MSDAVRIVEVSPRDGLQNEPTAIPTAVKAQLIADLRGAGLAEIEVASFVSPKWVPQMADAAELWPMLPQGGLYSALVPNAKGLERALETGVERIAVFTAASDAFVQHNIGMSLADSLATFADVVAAFRDRRPTGWVRGYVSTIFECPYAGRIAPAQVASVVGRLVELGVDEISLGDTIGVGAPREVRALHDAIGLPGAQVAWHFHDTRGTAVANVSAALDLGYHAFDASAGGLGGCPYAPGAGGNLATEDLVYFLQRSGLNVAVDIGALARATVPVLAALGRETTAKAQRAALASRPETTEPAR